VVSVSSGRSAAERRKILSPLRGWPRSTNLTTAFSRGYVLTPLRGWIRRSFRIPGSGFLNLFRRTALIHHDNCCGALGRGGFQESLNFSLQARHDLAANPVRAEAAILI